MDCDMNKKPQKKIAERQARARKKQFLKWRAEGGGDRTALGDMTHLLESLEQREAHDAKMSVDEWRALPEIEQIRRWEEIEDRKFAGGGLEAYRQQIRRRFEAGSFRPEYGQPMWLRTEYAREHPQKIANELAQLVFHGLTASGEILKHTIAAMECRTHRGWLGTGLGFAELKLRVEEEVDRLGLREQFNEALAREAANFERTIQ
jgi:hypothetical protein